MIQRILNENKRWVTYSALIAAYGTLECLWGLHPWTFAVLSLQLAWLLLALGLQKSVLRETGSNYRIYYAVVFLGYSGFDWLRGYTKGAEAALALVIILLVGAVVEWGYALRPKPSTNEHPAPA